MFFFFISIRKPDYFNLNLIFDNVYFNCLSLHLSVDTNEVNMKVGCMPIGSYLITYYKQNGFEASAI